MTVAWPDNTHLPDEGFILPRQPTAAILTVLRLRPEQTVPVARILQKAGVSVPRTPADELAHALFFLLPYAITWGDLWWVEAEKALVAMMPAETQAVLNPETSQ